LRRGRGTRCRKRVSAQGSVLNNPSDNFDNFARTADARANLARSSVRGFSYVLFSGGGEFAIRLASTAILARLISPDHFGLFMMVTAVTALADQFRDFGLSTATIQREHITHEEVSNLFWINTAAGIVMALIMCAVSPLVAAYFQEPRLLWITVALSATVLFGGLTVQHEALLGRQMRLGGKSGIRLLSSLLSAVVAIGMALSGFGYWSLVWREIARSGLILVGAWAICPWIPGMPRRDIEVRSHLRFGSGLTAAYMIGALTASLDRVLLGRFEGAVAVGFYRQSYQLVVTPMNQLMGPLYQVALPGLSMLQGDATRFRNFFVRIVSLVAAVSMPLSVFLAIYAEEIAAVILGNQWHGAAVFIRIFGIGGMLQSVFSTTGFVLVSRGQSSQLLALGTTTAVLKSVLMIVGLRWGPVGVAVADVSTTLIMFVPYLRLCFRNSPVTVSAFLGALARPFTASVVLAGLLVMFRTVYPSASTPITGLASGLVISAIVFPVAWVMLPGGRLELRELQKAMRAAVAKPAFAKPIENDAAAS
jgi:PST family polysaccharide transporter